MTVITIVESAGKLTFEAPFHPDFAVRAKKLGGKWSPGTKTWTFDARDGERVRALSVSLFGTDGNPETSSDVLAIRLNGELCDYRDTSYWFAGRQVARVLGRDSGARLGDGVVVLAGGFSSGGSVKNPRINRKDGTVIEIRDVPRTLAEKLHGEWHGITLLNDIGDIVAEATIAAPSVAEPTEAELLDRDIASTVGRLAGLRFRAAELRPQ